MIHSRVLEDDVIGGRRTIHHYDYATGQTTIEETMDVEHMVDINKALHNEGDRVTRYRGKELVRVASLPLVVWEDLKRRGILDDTKAFKAWLNDPENRFFRTAPGRV
jgi:hypothetical protein